MPERAGGRELRADARRNRAVLLAAAQAVLVERGIDAPMEEIARRAGVGIGTLYRRFPDRDALVGAVISDTVTSLVAIGEKELADGPTAWDALHRFLRQSVDLRLGVLLTLLGTRLFAALHADAELRAAREALIALLDRMVDAAQAEGTMRHDVGSGDVAMLLSLLLRQLPELPPELLEAIPARFLELMLDGLRARPHASDLPGTPTSAGDLGGT
jgi:AcrR family transcriptional regulator